MVRNPSKPAAAPTAEPSGVAADQAAADVTSQQLAAEEGIAPAMNEDQRRAAEKRRRAAIGDPGYREQNELDALLVERGRFVDRGRDTADIDAEIKRRGGSLPGEEG